MNNHSSSKSKEHHSTESNGESKRSPWGALSFVRMATVVYSVMSAAGLALMHFSHESLPAAFTAVPDNISIGQMVAMTIVGAAALLVLSELFEQLYSGYRQLKSVLSNMLGRASPLVVIYLALTSAVGEELLFRGGIQPFAGVFITSVLFALLHIGPDGRVSSWTVWTLIAGLFMGWTFENTGNILPAIGIHFSVNLINLSALRKEYQRSLKEKPIEDADPMAKYRPDPYGPQSDKNEDEEN